MKLFKSKQGFTLIELLVVIGILAVLAAIAIPSVAGLIDRANVSADATNANEMTNAVERFVSEYELYCQDLASNQVKLDNLDAAQGRVYNVTGADDRADIEALEGAGLDGKQINIDTKYPENIATLQAVVENYMKTSSATFTPKQSDCHFYYSPDCGLVVCTETAESDIEDLNALIQSGKDAKGKDLGASTRWIDVTANVSLSGGSSSSPEIIVGSATFNDGTTLTWEDLKSTDNGLKYGYNANAINDTSIDELAFEYCESLISITIPNNITSIGDWAFADCGNLTSIILSDSITNIGDGVFVGCISLESIIIPDSVTNIGDSVFCDCTSLESIIIPDSITNLSNETFIACSNLTNVTIGNGVTSIGDSAFSECASLKNITIPDSVLSIGDRAFLGCSNLESVTIGNGVTSIGELAFHRCDSLKNITIPDSVTKIDNHAFWECSNLTNVTIGNGVTNIGYYVFKGCSNLTNVIIGNNVTSIHHYAFDSCTNLTSITLPNSITYIDSGLFDRCTNLTEINYNGTMAEWNAIPKQPMSYNNSMPATYVQCSDGKVAI